MNNRWRRELFAALGVMAVAVGVALVLPEFRRRATQDAELPDFLIGMVVDERGPVAGAQVGWQGLSPEATTDSRGQFMLATNSDKRVVVAARQGYFNAAIRAINNDAARIVLRPLPAGDSAAYAWVDPRPDPSGEQNCANCHRAIYDEWNASGHARATTNRHFTNLFDGRDWHGRPERGWNLLAEHPDGAGVCAACHAPGVEPGTPAFEDPLAASGVATQGVHCDFCHKVAGAADGAIGRTHGRYGLALRRPAHEQVFFGPWGDAVLGDGAYAPIFRESRFCASCHEGTVFGTHVYGTYSEWQASPAAAAGKQCQDCHMAPTGQVTNVAPGKGGLERSPQSISSHRMLGDHAGRLREALRARIDLAPTGDELHVVVELCATDVGHRVPTGFVDRNLVLVVEALDAAGERIELRDGAALPAWAGDEVSGLAGKLYARQLRGPEGQQPVAFWQPQTEPVDTRLVPQRPDRSQFTFAPGAAAVRVRVLHRRFWPAVAEAKAWPDNELVVYDQVIEIDGGRRVTLAPITE